jgi:hypothetical protein
MNQKPSKLFAAASSDGAKPASNKSQLISVRLPEDLLQRLADVGNSEGFTMSDTLRVVLERGLRATPQKKGSQQ